MAIYTTFFLCKPEQLPGGFPGWRLPLAQPVRREFRNPFTGKVSTVETREPEWTDEPAREVSRDHQVVTIQGNYRDYLEGRLPPPVRANPHWAAKGLTQVELEPLGQAIGVEGAWEPALYAPPSSGATLDEMPAEMLRRLRMIDQRGLDMVAKGWAAAMSTPDYTHSVSGEKLSDGWTADQAMQLLSPIVELARRATDSQQMYLLIEA